MNEVISDELRARIEKKETDIIAHIRTSSMSKIRELFVVDEMLGKSTILSSRHFDINHRNRVKKDEEAGDCLVS